MHVSGRAVSLGDEGQVGTVGRVEQREELAERLVLRGPVELVDDQRVRASRRGQELTVPFGNAGDRAGREGGARRPTPTG